LDERVKRIDAGCAMLERQLQETCPYIFKKNYDQIPKIQRTSHSEYNM